MKYGVSIAIFPTAWALGYVRIRKKDMISFGPFRFCLHRVSKPLDSYYQR